MLSSGATPAISVRILNKRLEVKTLRAFEDVCPSVIFIYYCSLIGIVMFSQSPVLIALAMLGGQAYVLVGDLVRSARDRLTGVALFAILALINPIFSHNGRTVLLVINDAPITLEAVIYGCVSAAVIVTVLGLFRSFSDIMTRDKLLYVFGRISPRMALVLSLGLRYISLLRIRARAISDTQRALGLYKEDNIYCKFKSDLRVFSILITWALENGITTADSMTARGYGTAKRTYYSVFKFGRYDALLLCITLICFAITVLAMLLGALDTVYYPSIELEKMTPLALAAYFAYGLLAMLPAIIDLWERIRWRYLLSKM